MDDPPAPLQNALEIPIIDTKITNEQTKNCLEDEIMKPHTPDRVNGVVLVSE